MVNSDQSRLCEGEDDLPRPSLNQSNCFIATAVYGDINAPEVEILRQFRDSVLQETGIDSELQDTNVQQSIALALKEVFRPEFLNRIDEIITFHSLTMEDIKQIASIQIEKLNQRLKTRNLKISLDDKTMEYLARKGYDPSFGARPLKRVIQQEIENPLSMAILKDEFNREDTIEFEFDENAKKIILVK